MKRLFTDPRNCTYTENRLCELNMCLLVWLHVSASSPATDTSCPEDAPAEGTQLQCHPEHPDPEETPDVVIHNWNVMYCWELDSNSYSAVALCIRCIFSAKMNVMQVAIAYQILFMRVHWNFQYSGGMSGVLPLIFLPPICGPAWQVGPWIPMWNHGGHLALLSDAASVPRLQWNVTIIGRLYIGCSLVCTVNWWRIGSTVHTHAEYDVSLTGFTVIPRVQGFYRA